MFSSDIVHYLHSIYFRWNILLTFSHKSSFLLWKIQRAKIILKTNQSRIARLGNFWITCQIALLQIRHSQNTLKIGKLWVMWNDPNAPILAGVGLPYKNNRGACQKFWKESLRGTKILFYGRGLKCYILLRETNSKTRRYLVMFFSTQCPKRYCKSSCCGLFEAESLGGTKTTFLISKRYDEHRQAPICPCWSWYSKSSQQLSTRLTYPIDNVQTMWKQLERKQLFY